MSIVIEVKDLCKNFREKKALSNISFTIKQGDCLALIGPNGSGKTTLFNCLLGDLHPSSGQISVLHKEIRSPQLKEK
ncbi:ATP-binding cassette domain-containing protein, partial [Streptococcus pyogenes]